ncbi:MULTISPECIES: hypothetical protein [Shimia]|uniref:hypothetical protein n=1 Tax=Shimia TaxID=573139 RepID=UPI001FB1EC37|nr:MULTISPECIES: hypothetical protein [Shimia]MDV4145497.1 hypothetical protein [Shimia sp. FJ5]
MFLELIATIVAGIAAAGIMMVITRASGGRLPKWLTPVAAGAAMIAATISNEYGWYGRTSKSLPDEFMIVDTVESKALYRPWTYVRPYVDRFAALDVQSVQRHDEAPAMRMADMYFFGRWAPVNKLSVIADCAALRRAAVTEGVTLNADGSATGAAWLPVPLDDPLVSTMCEVS